MKILALLLALAGACPAAEPEETGLLFSAGLSQWHLPNAGPLAYTPFELGWDFGGGLRVQTGVDIFYYRARQEDQVNYKDLGAKQFYYEMTGWRSSLLYRVPLPIRLRPVMGLTAEAVGGKRRRDAEPGEAVSPAEAARELPAWSFFGGGLLAGLELILGPSWNLGLYGRYVFSFKDAKEAPSPMVLQSGITAVF